MRKRFTWILAVFALTALGVVVACSTKYTSSSNGLVVVPTLGSQVMQSFSLNLATGSVSQINNSDGPPIPGLPGSVLLDPAGAYAYVATTVDCTSTLPANTTLSGAVQAAIVAYKIDSSGKLSATSGPQYLTGNPTYPGGFPTCGLDDSGNPNAGNPITAIAMDSTGKFLFVATAPTSVTYTTNTDTTPVVTVANMSSVGVAVYSIGASAALTQVAGSPFALPTQSEQSPTPSALAVTPTVFPIQFAACSQNASPGTENLYVTDSVNYQVLNYSVDPSSGVLTLVPYSASSPGIATGSVPSGVTVDACNRFAYVANALTNNVSAYKICSSVSTAQNCSQADFSLQSVPGSPFVSGDAPGPLAVDAYGKFLYVVDTGSNQISVFQIGVSNGGLVSVSTAATAQGANSIAIRNDDSYLFVANGASTTLSEFAIAPASGSLLPQGSTGIVTFNLPTGVAVK